MDCPRESDSCCEPSTTGAVAVIAGALTTVIAEVVLASGVRNNRFGQHAPLSSTAIDAPHIQPAIDRVP